MAARTAARDDARAAGDRPLATAIAALPKPTTAAWVCNLLVRRQPEEVAQLAELAELLRAAQVNLSGDQLRELGRQRNQLVAALARQARGLAHTDGHDVSSAVAEQVEATLRAAVADPGAGAALQAGRLTTALSYSGLGPVDLGGAVATPVRASAPARTARPAGEREAGHRRRDGDQQRREAEEQRRREAAEQARRELAQARRDAEDAAAVATDAAAAAETADAEVTAVGERQDGARRRVERLERELRRARREAEEAAAAVADAQDRRDAAVRRAETAVAIRERAQARVRQLAEAVGDPSGT
ncbi:hypothetical protein [Modestobacter sp. L9-4]|uniref:hypothetical protein n=1 Tax=Modestobacter sp. L9-4 TaxID=2851567 RepID=UPI001F30279B|nr:hypothetical protein [Modestobacter sp. L9-4]